LTYREFKKLDRLREQDSNVGFALFYNNEVLHFCLPIALTTGLMWVHTQSYRILVEVKLGAEVLALLGVGLSITASLAGLVESLVTQYFFPKYYSAISKAEQAGRSEAWNELFRNAIAVFLPTSIFVACCGPFILRILVNQKFSDSIHIVYWGALIELARMLTNIVYTVSQSEMKTRSTILPYFVGALIVSLGVSGVLFSQVGDKIQWIPPILAFSGLAILITMAFQMKKLLPIQFNFKHIVKTGAYSLPFLSAAFIPTTQNSLFFSLLICGIFGLYLLWALSVLLKVRTISYK
jgi:O-antigen/teichoic acid export membrane protein